MAKRDDWFRNERWDETEQAAFFSRLARSRQPMSRLQHLGIKALYLTRSNDPAKMEAAFDLHERGRRDADAEVTRDPSPFFPQWAKNRLVEMARIRTRQGRPNEAVELFRRALDRESGAPDPYVIELACLLYTLGRTDEYPRMLELVYASFVRQQPVLAVLRATLFRYAEVQAVLADALGRRDDAAAFARSALAIADARAHDIRPDMNLSAHGATPAQLDALRSMTRPDHKPATVIYPFTPSDLPTVKIRG